MYYSSFMKDLNFLRSFIYSMNRSLNFYWKIIVKITKPIGSNFIDSQVWIVGSIPQHYWVYLTIYLTSIVGVISSAGLIPIGKEQHRGIGVFINLVYGF